MFVPSPLPPSPLPSHHPLSLPTIPSPLPPSLHTIPSPLLPSLHPDALSRVSAVHEGINYAFLATSQQTCADTLALRASATNLCFDAVHDLSHPGIRAMPKLLQVKFIWKGMSKDAGDWTCTCDQCQCVKVHRHHKAALQPFVPPDARFSHIHVDVVGRDRN